MAIISSLANHLLIAMPALGDPHFKGSVIYICEHDKQQGTVGLIINQPMQWPLSVVFKQLEIEPIQSEKNGLPLLFGGPIQPERGFVIHKQVGGWRSSLFLQNDVIVTTSNDIIRAIASDAGVNDAGANVSDAGDAIASASSPKDFLVALGYSGWVENQLEREVMDNIWLVCPFKQEILYEVPFEQRWEYAGSILGIKMNQLSSSSGHA